MNGTSPGSFRLFQAFGINVFIHWSWFVVALIQFQYARLFASPFWHVATYVTLFGIVLLHEFGHALACRSVGGRAERIVLWPLGGIAFVQPPQRPGAVLWSIIAGPLVNVLLVPVTFVAQAVVVGNTPDAALSDLQQYVVLVTWINLALLIFNMLPIYPLDGGQTLQAILWFFMGRASSLKVTATVGLIAAVVGGIWVLTHWEDRQDLLLVAIAVFIGWQAWNGLRYARMLARSESWRM